MPPRRRCEHCHRPKASDNDHAKMRQSAPPVTRESSVRASFARYSDAMPAVCWGNGYDPRCPKLDGLGAAIDPDAYYYVQDARQYVGNDVYWWRPKSDGYTCDIDAAGQYEGSSVLEMRETDIPWPVAVVNANITRHVDIQRLRRATAQPEAK